MNKFKFLPHTADIKFVAYGKTLNKVFENAVMATFNAMYKGRVKSKIKKKISVSGEDLDSLLYNLLERAIILVDAEDFLVSKLKIKIDNKNMMLTGELYGDKIKNYPVGLSIKAVTYNDMFVKKISGVWKCQVVLDV